VVHLASVETAVRNLVRRDAAVRLNVAKQTASVEPRVSARKEHAGKVANQNVAAPSVAMPTVNVVTSVSVQLESAQLDAAKGVVLRTRLPDSI
jgi:hypothetical protein